MSKLAGSKQGYPVTGYPLLLYQMKSTRNFPDWNRMVQLPDIRSDPTPFFVILGARYIFLCEFQTNKTFHSLQYFNYKLTFDYKLFTSF